MKTLPVLSVLFAFGPAHAVLADQWEAVLQQGLESEYSQTRHDALKQVDTKTVKGLRALWKVLALRDPMKIDWYVRKGAQAAIAKAEGPDANKEIDRVLGVSESKAEEGATASSGLKGSVAAEDELAREAIVYAIIEKVREAVVRKLADPNDDNEIAEFRYKLRRTHGVKYFALVLEAIQEYDPKKIQLRRLQTAFGDKSPRVRRAAIQGLTVYPDGTTIPLLIENLKKLEKQKAKQYREWVLTRAALETLSGRYYRESVEDWVAWWDIEKGRFSIQKRVDEEKKDPESTGKTVVAKAGGVEVELFFKVAGQKDGYPLLVLPLEGKEVDYMRPYFHGVEEFCRVFYLRMPQLEDFKGLERDKKSNTVIYPTEILAEAVADILELQNLKRFAVLAHGPSSGTLAMMFAAKNPEKVTHLVLVNPRSAGDVYWNAMENVRREGFRTGNREIVKGIDSVTQMDDGTTKYKAADDAEAGGLGRALHNVHFVDPTEPEVGLIDELYDLPGGMRRSADVTWSARKILAEAKVKANLPTLIVMGEKAVWTPLQDQHAVAKLFQRAVIAKMAESADYPFISETYAFTKHIEKFLKPALELKKPKARKANEQKGKTEAK